MGLPPPSLRLLRWLLAYPFLRNNTVACGVSSSSSRWLVGAATASEGVSWRRQLGTTHSYKIKCCSSSTATFASSRSRAAFISTTTPWSSSSTITLSFSGGGGGWWRSPRRQKKRQPTVPPAATTRAISSSSLFSTKKHQKSFSSSSSSSPHRHKQQYVNNNNNNNNNSDDNNNIITSTSSNTVKKIVALQTKRKKRKELQETIVEGPKMVMDLLKNVETRSLIRQIVISTDIGDEIQEELDSYLDLMTESESTKSTSKIMIQKALPNILKACCDTVTPQGIIARVSIPNWDIETDVVNVKKKQQAQQQHAHQQQAAPLYLILDGVSDPGNVGTLLRSSVACGVRAVVLLPGCCDIWNPKAVRSAMGGTFLVPTFTFDSWSEALRELQSSSSTTSLWDCHQFYAATMLDDDDDDDDNDDSSSSSSSSSSSCAHYDINWNNEQRQPQALIIGNEGNGLSEPIRKSLMKDKTVVKAVHVPMQGTIESLNAAVCGSVILFEYMRQCQQQQQQ